MLVGLVKLCYLSSVLFKKKKKKKKKPISLPLGCKRGHEEEDL